MKKYLFFVLFLMLLPVAAWAVCDSIPPKKNGKNIKYDPEFDAYLDGIIQLDIPVITCEQLKILQQTNREMAILDVRSKEEYHTSHIVNARWVGYEDFSIERIWAIDRNKPVVVYGSTGEQSERIGQEMKKMGFKDVRNLYSSIFEWMYEGGKLVDKNGNPTDKIQIFAKQRLRFLHSPY